MTIRTEPVAGFRALVWPTLFVIPALAILVGLGVWQLERRTWKHELIERTSERTEAESVALPAPSSWASLDPDQWEYRPVEVHGIFEHHAEVHVYAVLSKPRGALGGTGYWVFTPLRLESGEVVFINRGFVPEALKSAASRAQGQIQGEVAVSGLLRKTEPMSTFVPPPDTNGNVWYARNVQTMVEARKLDDVAPFYIDDGVRADNAIPQGGETRLKFEDSHLGYAVTWFGLAGALVVVYLAFCRVRTRQSREQ